MVTDLVKFQEVLEANKGNPTRTCEALSISRSTFYRLNRMLRAQREAQSPGDPSLIDIGLDVPEGVSRPMQGAFELSEQTPSALRTLLQQVIGKPTVDETKIIEIVDRRIRREHYRSIEIKNTSTGESIKIEGLVPSWFQDVLFLVQQIGDPVLLVGPMGSGKTTVAQLIAKAMGLRYGFLSLSGGISESHLTGWLVPGDGGKFEYLQAPFVDFYENGGLFLLDEADAMDPNVGVQINAALANGQLAIPQRKEKPIAVKHKDFRLIAAANTYGSGATREYQGRNPIDGATLDRFIVYSVDYDEHLERKLVDEKIYEMVTKVRANIIKHKFRRTISTRKMIQLSRMKEAGAKSKFIEDRLFEGWNPDEIKKAKEE